MLSNPFTFVKITVISYGITVGGCDRNEKIIKAFILIAVHLLYSM